MTPAKPTIVNGPLLPVPDDDENRGIGQHAEFSVCIAVSIDMHVCAKRAALRLAPDKNRLPMLELLAGYLLPHPQGLFRAHPHTVEERWIIANAWSAYNSLSR